LTPSSPDSPLPRNSGLRVELLRGRLQSAGLDGLLVSQPENRRYLSGFTGSAGWLLISAEQAMLATDFRYYEQATLESPLFELVKLGSGLPQSLAGTLQRTSIRRLGFESDHATFNDVQAWSKSAPSYEWVPVQGVVEGLRAVKDPEEVAEIREAVSLADAAFVDAAEHLRPGITELELAWRIETFMRTHGAEGVSFELIVAGGPNGARPHARATRAPLPLGEPIVIDIGARVNGYCSDLTRTVCLGQPNDPGRFWEIFTTVLRAQQAAEAAIRPGLTGEEVDAVARDLISEAGYAEFFGHGLGHGVGLAIHEEPRASRTNPSALVAGNVLTIEPGIYLPGWGGVRIEDMVHLSETGADVLSAAPKDPIIRIR
jgi:Xaa-Pro aminopeptidase